MCQKDSALRLLWPFRSPSRRPTVPLEQTATPPQESWCQAAHRALPKAFSSSRLAGVEGGATHSSALSEEETHRERDTEKETHTSSHGVKGMHSSI